VSLAIFVDGDASLGHAGTVVKLTKARDPTRPEQLEGLKVAIALAFIGAVIGEFMASNEGLGNLMLVANSQISTTLAFAALFGLATIDIYGSTHPAPRTSKTMC
jgi:hypothetical protein